MKRLLLIACLAIAGCASLPVDVFQLRGGDGIESVRAQLKARPDSIVHERNVETWIFKDAGIVLVFEDGKLRDFRN